jgi:tRNA 2-selenouridine synthase
MDLPQIDDYQSLFIEDVPLLDVRAPVEFQQGAFPNASNVPLIDNEERHAIGIRYKESGQDQAIELGHQLVKGDIKESRVNTWAEFTRQYPQGALYCFRGGMRSRISQQWIYDKTGVVYPRIKGGYKALRRYLIDELNIACREIQPIILSGRTGVGKTLLLNRIRQKVDLEALFVHRGSAFGKHITPQPSQIDIENTLAIELLKLRGKNVIKLVLEDEGTNIGSRRLPECIFSKMTQSPLILLEAGIEQREEIVFEEYIINALAEYQGVLGDDKGFDSWAGNLTTALEKIQRRLGGLRYQNLKAILEDAINRHCKENQAEHHKTWIRVLLAEYYDPMYDYQLSKKADRVVFRGERDYVLDYLNREQNVC